MRATWAGSLRGARLCVSSGRPSSPTRAGRGETPPRPDTTVPESLVPRSRFTLACLVAASVLLPGTGHAQAAESLDLRAFRFSRFAEGQVGKPRSVL